MPQQNQAVLDMIGQLRARLTDLEQDVKAFDGDLSYLATKLDRIDDRVYLLETEVEELARRKAREAAKEEAASEDGAAKEGSEETPETAPAKAPEDAPAKKADDDSDDNGLNILTPEAKEKIGETVGDMREIGREAAETFASLNEAFGDITAPFKSFMKPGRRR